MICPWDPIPVWSTSQRRVPEEPSGLIFSIWPRWALGVSGSWIVRTKDFFERHGSVQSSELGG